MSDQHPYLDADIGSDREPRTGTPRWVKVSGVILLMLVVLLVIMRLTGVGGHDPGNRGDHGLVNEASGASLEQVSGWDATWA